MLEYGLTERFEIYKVFAREVIDSRGNPTVETEALTKGGGLGRACAPSGASTGRYEAWELRDDDERRFRGKGVSKAVKNVNEEISKRISGKDSRRQKDIDRYMIEMDGTENKTRLGANAILSVSLAIAKAAADTTKTPLFRYLGGEMANVLPTPMMNVINGGKHAGNELQFQEFMIMPVGSESFKEALRKGSEVYHALKQHLKKKYGRSAINIGDEGGFAPPMKETREALNALKEAVKLAGYSPGGEIVFALDAASTEFYNGKDETYLVDGKKCSKLELIEFYEELINEFPIMSIEDPLQEEDFDGFAQLTERTGRKVQLVGDDVFVTNVKRLKRGIEAGAGNALLLKVNQIGTLTEALDAARLASDNGYNVVISHRSGETEDTTIADIAVALNTGQIKTGAPARGERTAKYNRLLRIEEYLGGEATYAGPKLVRAYDI